MKCEVLGFLSAIISYNLLLNCFNLGEPSALDLINYPLVLAYIAELISSYNLEYLGSQPSKAFFTEHVEREDKILNYY